MSSYCFILGKDPELSIAELYAVYPDALFTAQEREFLLMETQEKIDQQAFNRLGGVVKLAKIEKECDADELDEALVEVLLSDHTSGKLQYGVSVYGMPESQLRAILINLKKLLKSANISSRFANQNFLNLSIAQRKGLNGPEIVLVKVSGQFMLGKVVATQDIDAYSKRDYEKPFRDMKVGMLPPKLAQILINLTRTSGVVWDPFCGGGVLLMEGLLMGRNMLGSDIDEATLEGAEENVEWMKREFDLSAKVQLFLHDATDPVPDIQFEAIAFEGYLGPPQTKIKSERELKTLFSQLDQLYFHFFMTLKKADFRGSIVAALPFFKAMQDREVGLGCIEKIEELGFKAEALLPGKSLNRLRYARKDQLVGREIYRFRLGS